MKKLGLLANPYRVEGAKHFRLRDFDPDDTGKLSPNRASAELQRGIEELSDLGFLLQALPDDPLQFWRYLAIEGTRGARRPVDNCTD